MLTFNSLEQNHGFLILETCAQFEDAMSYLEAFRPELLKRMRLRNELIRNMKNTMENDCFQQLFAQPDQPEGEVQKIRSLHRISLACRRIANHCVNMCHQTKHMADPSLLGAFAWKDMARTAKDCLRKIPGSLDAPHEEEALELCRGEQTLDDQYDAVIDDVASAAKLAPNDFQELLVVVLVARYLEAVGDELLRIGEALLSALVGERIQYHEYQSLRRGLAHLGRKALSSQNPGDPISYKAFWGSRSGCVIGRVTSGERRTIFKEGPVEKVRREKDNMLAWDRAVPGMVPAVLDYFEQAGQGSLLMEEIKGTPLDEILLERPAQDMEQARQALTRTLSLAWNRTIEPGPITPKYMAQVLERLDKIRQVHPDLGSPEARLETALTRINRAGVLERGLAPAFSVFIHGDFNLNNIFYDKDADAVRFVDIYRSRRSDYIQDVSVHLASYFRIPVFDRTTRAAILHNIVKTADFAESFARQQADDTMQARLTLALARSLITSTRFELRRELASAMFSRAYAMLDALLAHDGAHWRDFRAPIGLLDLNGEGPEAQEA